MIEQFDYWEDADAVMAALAADPSMSGVLEAVNRTLARIAEDPFDRRLGTIPFMTPELGGINATPVRYDDWYIFWQRGEKPSLLDIVLVEQLDVGREL